MSRLTTLTFDLWQTLILDSPAVGQPRGRLRLEGAQAALRDAGYAYAMEDLQQAMRRTSAMCNEIREREGDASFEEQVGMFLQQVDGEMALRLDGATRGLVEQRYADSYFAHPPAVDPEAAAVLAAVRGMGYRLGLICNTGSTPGVTQRVFLAEQGLAQYFATLTFSDEERLSKPAARIFHATLERLGATAGEAVHIGDHPRNDVTGAKRAGLRAVWLRREGEEKRPEVAADAEIACLGELPGALARLAAG